MKLHQILILSGLLLGIAPAVSYAACSPACASGIACRITAQGPPTVYQCASSVRAGRGLAGPATAQSGVTKQPQAFGTGNQLEAVTGQSGATQKSIGPNASASRTTGPKVGGRPPAALKEQEISIESVKSPRDATSGQATGKRRQQP